MQRVRIGTDDSIPALNSAQDVDSTTRERTLAHLAAALQEASGHPVEQHSTGFGFVLVVRLNEPYYLAFALAAAWPMAVLEVHCLDRDAGTTDPLDAPTGLTALDPTQRARKAAKKTVITYQMPQGVEHFPRPISRAPWSRVITYQMPQGVEH